MLAKRNIKQTYDRVEIQENQNHNTVQFISSQNVKIFTVISNITQNVEVEMLFLRCAIIQPMTEN